LNGNSQHVSDVCKNKTGLPNKSRQASFAVNRKITRFKCNTASLAGGANDDDGADASDNQIS
jgi:hypothetical protein